MTGVVLRVPVWELQPGGHEVRLPSSPVEWWRVVRVRAVRVRRGQEVFLVVERDGVCREFLSPPATLWPARVVAAA